MMMRNVPSIAAVVWMLGLAAGAADALASSGTLSGVVIDQRDQGDTTSLLMTFGQVGDSPMDEVRLTVPRNTPEPRPAFLPPGWRFVRDGRKWTLSGPALEPPLRARTDLPAGSNSPERIDVTVMGDGSRLFRARGLQVGIQPPIPPGGMDPAEYLDLPPTVMAGGSLSGVVVDEQTTPADGEWSVAGVAAQPDPNNPARLIFHLPVNWTGGRLPVRYRDPWGQTLIDADDIAQVTVLPPAQSTLDPGSEPFPPPPIPQISDCGARTGPGGRHCVCGHFPDAAMNPPLFEIDGIPVEPVTVSEQSAWLDMPGGLTAGEHTLRLASHPERGGACAFRLVTVTGTIDSEKLLRGESTQMRLLVQGTDQPLELTITNRSPAQILIAGGEDQSVMSSGGASNEIRRDVQALQPGNYDIGYALAPVPPCVCEAVIGGASEPPATSESGAAEAESPPTPGEIDTAATASVDSDRPALESTEALPTVPIELVAAPACAILTEAESRPLEDIDLQISESAVDPAALQRAEDRIKQMIREIIRGENEEYGAPEPLAAVYALWAINHIGGYAQAVSKTLVANQYGFWNDFITNTEHLKASAKGEREVTMRGITPQCVTTIVGTGVVRQVAHSHALDPTANSIEILRGVNTAGKIAFEIVKAYFGKTPGAGVSKASHAKSALKGAIQDHIEGEIQDEAVEQLAEWLESEDLADAEDFKELVKLINAINDDKLQEHLLRQLSDELDVAIKWLTLDLEPADFAPVASDTFAKVKGRIEITVGGDSGTSSAESNVLYRRESLDEDPEEVMHGGGTDCPAPVIVKDTRQGSMTSTIHGEAALEAQAQGNGIANAYLGSSTALAKVGICVCPDGTWAFDSHYEHGYFSGKPGDGGYGAGNNQIKIEADILGNRFEDYLNGLDGHDTPPEGAEVEQALEDLMREWADDYPVCGD